MNNFPVDSLFPGDDVSLRWMITLLHFLWQGTVVGIVVATASRLLRQSSASLRYAFYSAALVSLPVCVVVTLVVAQVPRVSRNSFTTANSAMAANDAAPPIELPVFDRLAPEFASVPQTRPTPETRIERSLPVNVRGDELPAEPALLIALSRTAPWFAVCYVVGAGCFLLRLSTALWRGHRLKATATPLSDSRLPGLIAVEARKVGLRLIPVVKYCERVTVPTVVGILRPVVLLPASIMTGLSSEEFAAIISHEVAHIRRHDLWMNLLQRVVESLLFIHPAVWFISRRLSAERELCCDDLVVSSGNEPMNYAGALLRVAELCAISGETNAAALAASGDNPSLLERRIQRLLIGTKTPRLQLTRTGVLALLLALTSLVAIPGALHSLAHADESPATNEAAVDGKSADVVTDQRRGDTGNGAVDADAAAVQADRSADEVKVKYPYCVVDVDNLKERHLSEAIRTFNEEAMESPIGEIQRPITEQETRHAIAEFVKRDDLPDPVKVVLRDIATSGTLPANVYFRRFTRFDDENAMHGVWWVRLVVEGPQPPVYSVPVRTTEIFSRPYTQMERQQNAQDGLMLINRFCSYFEEPPNILLLAAFPQDAIDRLVSQADEAIKVKNTDAFQSLFEWKGTSESIREFVQSEFRMLTKAAIHSIRVTPRNFRGTLIHWSAYQHYEANLPIVGYLDIEYTPADDASGRKKTLSLEMGKSGDELRLVNYVEQGKRNLPEGAIIGLSIRGQIEPLPDGTYLTTDIITNPGTLLSAHLANEEVRQRRIEDATKPQKPAEGNDARNRIEGTQDAQPQANRFRIINHSGEPVANATIRVIYQTMTYRELIAHRLKHETKTDDDGYFDLPPGSEIADAMDNGGLSATWVTVPVRDGTPEQTWLLGTGTGAVSVFLEAIMAAYDNSADASPAVEGATPKQLPTTFRLPKSGTSFRVIDPDETPAADVEVTPTQLGWIYRKAAIKPIVVPEILRASYRQVTDANGMVTFNTIQQVEFAEVEFKSERHGLQRTFSNENTIGDRLAKDAMLFPVGKVSGRIATTLASQKEFLRGREMTLKTMAVNQGLPVPKGYRVAMEGIATVVPDEDGRFEVPAMMAGRLFLIDRLPDDADTRVLFPEFIAVRKGEQADVEGRVISAVAVHGVLKKRGTNEPVASAAVSIRHGGRQSGLSRELIAYSRTDGKGRFEAKVFPGRIGYSSLTVTEGFTQAWEWDQNYSQEWPYGQHATVPDNVATHELAPLQLLATRAVTGKVIDVEGKPVAKTGVYARSRKTQSGNDFAMTNEKGEFALKRFPESYSPDYCMVGEQYHAKEARIVSRNPLVLQVVAAKE